MGLEGKILVRVGCLGFPGGDDNAGGSSSPEPRGKSRLNYKPDKYDGTNLGLCNAGVWPSYGCLHVLLLDCTSIYDFRS